MRWALSLAMLIAIAILGHTGPARAQTNVVVNGMAVPAETLAQLQMIYANAIPPGRYWYDAMSGAYGLEGGPAAGQILPGLSLGGPLDANASRGTSQVFINGRRITISEQSYLERACSTAIAPGRYWVNAAGIGGIEGFAPSFNLALCGGGGGGQSGGSSTRTFCDANGACTSTGVLGSILTAPR